MWQEDSREASHARCSIHRGTRGSADLPEVLYFAPQDAPAGFAQIPYQRTLEAMGAAADAGDIAAVRRMWNDTLSGMFYNEKLVARIQKEVDVGDPEVLRQLFS
ncbi:hypothetical protein [Microbacterium sp. NPDC058345]|uniref:hypothetical protein n=1 Tax=Microbacterium sp. NPDC058345 TaxID=3346455 RepID=UPI00364D9AD7